MAFTRDEIAQYEQQPAKVVEDSPASAWSKDTPVVAETKASDVTPAPVDASTLTDGSHPEGEVEKTAESTTAPVAEAEAPVAESAESDSVTPTEEVAAQDGEKPRRGEARERIEELVTERNALRKYGEHLLKTVEELRRVNAPPKTASEATEVAEDEAAPTLEQHQYDPTAFAKAQNEWLAKQVEKRVSAQVAAKVAAIEAQKSEVTVAKEFERRVEDFRKAHSDFDVVIANPALPTLHQVTARSIIKSETGPDIAYHLAKNPDVAARIARMEPDQQLMAIGRIDAQLTAQKSKPEATVKPQTPQRTVTKAPPPPKPVATGSGVVHKDISTMSMDEFVAHERAQKLAAKEQNQKMRQRMR